jgi:cytidylate kinase
MSTSSSNSQQIRAEGQDAEGRRVAARPLVTLAAYFGAGGDVLGPRVAERLGVEFLDRGIPRSVARRLQVPEEAAAEYDEQYEAPRGLGRLFQPLSRVPGPDGTPLPALQDDESAYQSETEELLARTRTTGGVVLGRGGMVILRSLRGVLHVMLGGPRDARLQQAMQLYGLDRATAEDRLDVLDRARVDYVRRRYGVDPDDPGLYHLRIDSTAVDLDTCVDVIVVAARSRAEQAGASDHGPELLGQA